MTRTFSSHRKPCPHVLIVVDSESKSGGQSGGRKEHKQTARRQLITTSSGRCNGIDTWYWIAMTARLSLRLNHPHIRVSFKCQEPKKLMPQQSLHLTLVWMMKWKEKCFPFCLESRIEDASNGINNRENTAQKVRTGGWGTREVVWQRGSKKSIFSLNYVMSWY